MSLNCLLHSLTHDLPSIQAVLLTNSLVSMPVTDTLASDRFSASAVGLPNPMA